MDAIEFRNLSFQYADGNEKVLKNVNFSIPYGCVTLLTGRTGIGKSTLLKLLTRVIPEDIPGKIEGNILIDGESIAKKKVSDIARKIGFIMQDPECQIFHENVHDEILFGMENFDFPRDKALLKEQEILRFIKLKDTDKTRTLSGGQKALLIIRSIMAMEQRILVLDEPLANLDLENSLKLLSMLKEESKKGKSIIICEHRTSLVLGYADRVYHLDNGRMKEGVGDYDLPFEGIKKERNNLSSKVLLEALGLKKSFNEKKVLDNIDLNLEESKIDVILGSNGQGKTTLLNCLSGQLKIKKQEGCIRQFITKGKIGKRKWFRSIGVVFQNPTYELFSSSVRKELCFHLKDKEFALKIADRLHLNPLLDRHPQSLSEGEKRRLTIACALAKKARIVFLDEPTVGQDKKSLENIIDILNDYAKEFKASIFIITHDEQATLSLADEAYVLDGGKLNPCPDIRFYFEDLRRKAQENAVKN